MPFKEHEMTTRVHTRIGSVDGRNRAILMLLNTQPSLFFGEQEIIKHLEKLGFKDKRAEADIKAKSYVLFLRCTYYNWRGGKCLDKKTGKMELPIYIIDKAIKNNPAFKGELGYKLTPDGVIKAKELEAQK